MIENSEKLFDPTMNLNSFQQLVEASANGLTIHHHATPETQNLFKEASKLTGNVPTPNSCSESKKVWDKFVTYVQNRGFNPLEATSDDVVTWIIQRSQDTVAPAQVQFELQAIKTWRLQAGKPLGYIPFETSVAKGLFNFLDPSQNGILGFEPDQLQAMIRHAVTEEKTCNYASLRQAALLCVEILGYC